MFPYSRPASITFPTSQRSGEPGSPLLKFRLARYPLHCDRRNLPSSSKKSWAGKRRGLLSQYLVNERDRDRPFADSRGDAFDVAATNIPGGENSGHTAFQQVGPTGERPVRAGQLFCRKVGTCFNEAFVVEHDATIEPAGVGVRSGHYEHVSDVLLLAFAGLAIPPRDPFEMLDAFQADNFHVCQQADVRRLFNATNEIF